MSARRSVSGLSARRSAGYHAANNRGVKPPLAVGVRSSNTDPIKYQRSPCRMASRAKFYLSGVDTLILNAKIATETIEPSKQQEVPQRIEQMLSEWLTIAKQQEEHYETTWKHEGRVLTLELSGTQHYRYLLTNKLIDLMIGPRLCNGAPVRVRFQR